MPVELSSRPLPSYGRTGKVVECFTTADAAQYWLVVETESTHGKTFEVWRGECESDFAGRPSIPSPCVPTRLVRRFANHGPMIRTYIEESMQPERRVPTPEGSSLPASSPLLAPPRTLDEVLMQQTTVLVQAIQDTFDALAVLVGPDAAAKTTRAVVATALEQVLGAKTPAPVSAPVVASRGPSVRGPKPGGRQLKIHVGPKMFDSMSNAAKDGARAAITAAGAGWGRMSKAAKDRVLGPHLAR